MKKFFGFIIVAVIIISMVIITNNIKNYWEEMDNIEADYRQEYEIANVTSRINLNSCIDNFQEIGDELQDLNTPIWISNDAKEHFGNVIDLTITGFVVFMANQGDNCVENAVVVFEQAVSEMVLYEEARER